MNGPIQLRDERFSLLHEPEVKREAYSFARKQFQLKGIAEIPKDFEELQWNER